MSDQTCWNVDLIKQEINNLNQYLESIDVTPKTIKVLENTGDFSFILKFPQFNKYDVTLTVQIPDDKNIINSNVVLNISKTYEKLENLSEIQNKIENHLKTNEFNKCLLVNFYIESMKLIEESYGKLEEKNNKKTKTKQQIQKSELKTKNEIKSEQNDEIKKNSMKTSADVVHRILWDSEINKEFISVGYLDRFSGIKECPFDTFDWGDIVLADLGALAIPQHRINYFKYKNEVIWDKNQRKDDVFGSTGSNITIYDVIKRLSNIDFKTEIPVIDENNKIEKPKSMDPNYFLAIPIDNKEIKMNIAKLTQDLIDNEPLFKKILMPDSSLHLTLCTLRLENDEELKNAIDVLNKAKNEFNKFLPINFNFKSIECFYDKVLYIDCNCDYEKLKNLREFILNLFKNSNISIAGNYYEFVPHLTIAKIGGRLIDENIKSKKIKDLADEDLFKKYENFNFGNQLLTELDLCKMVNIFKFLTYPVEYTLKFDN